MTPLGIIDVHVLNAIRRLGGIAVARRIEDELLRSRGKVPSAGQVYQVLKRLRERGFVKSSWSNPTNIAGGRRKRVNMLTSKGNKALDAALSQLKS